MELERNPYYQPTQRINYNPNAVQALKNLFGNYFAKNAYSTPQYQPTPYQTTLPRYMNYSPAVTELTAQQQQDAENYRNYIAPVVPIVAGYAANQLGQNGLFRAGMGATPGEALAPAISYFAATRLAPLGTVGKTAGKYFGKIADWIW